MAKKVKLKKDKTPPVVKTPPVEGIPKPDFVNPIDPDKIAENASFLPYATSVGGAVIKAVDKGRIKGNAMMAMYEQTDRQMQQLRDQMETLVNQAKNLSRRKEVSEIIYKAALNFRPVVGHTYHLYRKRDDSHTISLIGPDEWGSSRMPYTFLATCQLLYDHTWEVISLSEDEDFLGS
jgi:hypothetical protein